MALALTQFQRDICKIIAESRKRNGASYIAGGVSLCDIINSPRVSQDIDVFNDTYEALILGWENDRNLLLKSGYGIQIVRERPTFVEANGNGKRFYRKQEN